MRITAITAFVLCAGCVSGGGGEVVSVTDARGASLSLVSYSRSKATLELRNLGASPLAYDHWMSQGPEPVPHCRDSEGQNRICASRVFLTPKNEPDVHEAYLQPGASVRFVAAPSQTEQVGIHVWRDGQGEHLWLDGWTPESSQERKSKK